MKPEPLTFPGIELFSGVQAAQLGSAIQRYTDLQPALVRDLLTSSDVAWRPDGAPDTIGTSLVEETVKARSCAALAIETARALGQELTAEQALEVIKQAELVYAEVPHLVHAILSPTQ